MQGVSYFMVTYWQLAQMMWDEVGPAYCTVLGLMNVTSEKLDNGVNYTFKLIFIEKFWCFRIMLFLNIV